MRYTYARGKKLKEFAYTTSGPCSFKNSMQSQLHQSLFWVRSHISVTVPLPQPGVVLYVCYFKGQCFPTQRKFSSAINGEIITVWIWTICVCFYNCRGQQGAQSAKQNSIPHLKKKIQLDVIIFLKTCRFY